MNPQLCRGYKLENWEIIRTQREFVCFFNHVTGRAHTVMLLELSYMIRERE